MHIKDIDMRIAPLHDVIVGIDAGLAAIHERLDTEEEVARDTCWTIQMIVAAL